MQYPKVYPRTQSVPVVCERKCVLVSAEPNGSDRRKTTGESLIRA
ncbi:MAG: hypothetical protein AAFR89_01870 [Cyanobacteria bacterium J06633_1]